MINAYWEDLNFRIQEGDANDWMRIADTSKPGPLDLVEIGTEEPIASLDYKVNARSVVVLLRAASGAATK
jgi:isoamylase